MSDIEQRIANSAPEPTRPLDAGEVWRQAQRRRHRRWSAITAGAASLVLLAGAGLVAAGPGAPQPMVDAPDEQPPPPPGDDRDEEPDEGRDEPEGPEQDSEPDPVASDVETTQPADRLAGREFVATEIRDQDRSYALVEDTWLHLEFAADPEQVQVRWHAGCHQHRAPVTVTGQHLEIGEITRAEVQDCPPAVEEQEQWLQGLLTAGPRWQLEDSQLQLRGGEAIVEFEQGPPPQPEDEASDPPDAAVEPLVKADGFRDDLEIEDVPWALLEIAYDRQTAERAWEQNVPDDLPERGGQPAEPGRYGDFAQVDFDRQALVVWHAGQSGTCPAWLDDVNTDAAGDVHVEIDTTAEEGEFCTDDYRGYRMVLAVDRDRLPDPDQLPRDTIRDDHPVDRRHDGRVTAYP